MLSDRFFYPISLLLFLFSFTITNLNKIPESKKKEEKKSKNNIVVDG